MNRKDLMPIIQNYIGMTPKDKGCTHWSEMQNKMADEIMALDNLDKPHRDIDDWIFKAHQNKDRYILITSDVAEVVKCPVYCKDFQIMHDKYHELHHVNGMVVLQIVEVYEDGTADENLDLKNLW